MNIPEKIKIGWKEYTVENTEVRERLVAVSDECYGEIDYNENVIRLNDKYNEERKKATLIHEVLHGISEMYTLDMSEDLVTKLADALYTVIKDNPEIFKAK